MNEKTRKQLDKDLKSLLLTLESSKEQCSAMIALAASIADDVTAPTPSFDPSVHVLRHGWREYWHPTKPNLLYGLFTLDYTTETDLTKFQSKPKKAMKKGSKEAKAWNEGVKKLLDAQQEMRMLEAENQVASEALELAFVAMVRFIKDSDTPADQASNMNALHHSIRTYLKSRGVKDCGVGMPPLVHPDGPAPVGRMFYFRNKGCDFGRAALRFKLLALLWNHRGRQVENEKVIRVVYGAKYPTTVPLENLTKLARDLQAQLQTVFVGFPFEVDTSTPGHTWLKPT